MRVYQSLGMRAGPSLTRLHRVRRPHHRGVRLAAQPPDQGVRDRAGPEWTDGGQVYVRQSDPLPLTLVSMILEAEVGG
jgi:hypothetical protein